MVFCTKCGQENPDESTHCSNCGKSLFRPTPSAEPVRPPPHRPRRARRSSDVCWEEDTKGPGRGGIIVIGIVFIFVSIIVYSAINFPDDFAAFWENFGRQFEGFFESGIWALGFGVLGLIIILYALFIHERKR